MIRMSAADLRRIERAAEVAYPREACGLLVGRDVEGGVAVEEVVASPNVAGSDDEFEVDPQVRIDLERRLRGCNARLVGLYHSHPDHPAQPSQRDAERAWEPALVWVITAVSDGRVTESRAHALVGAAGQFEEVALRVVREHEGAAKEDGR